MLCHNRHSHVIRSDKNFMFSTNFFHLFLCFNWHFTVRPATSSKINKYLPPSESMIAQLAAPPLWQTAVVLSWLTEHNRNVCLCEIFRANTLFQPHLSLEFPSPLPPRHTTEINLPHADCRTRGNLWLNVIRFCLFMSGIYPKLKNIYVTFRFHQRRSVTALIKVVCGTQVCKRRSE